MNRIKIVFRMFFLYHKAAFDPLLDLFRNDEKFDVALSLTHEVRRTLRMFELKRNDIYLKKFREQGYRIAGEKEHFDIQIVPDTVGKEYFGDWLLCFLNHGTGIKNILYRHLRSHPSHKYMLFVEGDYRVEKIKESGGLKNSKIIKVGLPKMDPYFWEEHFNREQILKSLGLDPSKRTVLFAPTYKPTCVYDVKDAIFKATKDYNLIIKLHHYAWMGKYARHSQHRIFERRLAKYPHAVIVPQDNYNIIPFMYAADTLVSEASSTIFDFLATGKIGVIYNLNHEKLKHSDGDYILKEDNSKFLKDSFVHVSNPDELHEGIAKALQPPEAMLQSAAHERNYYFYKLDGKASERTKAEIERLYEAGIYLNHLPKE